MNINRTNIYTFTINRSVLWLIVLGFILLLSVILFEGYINGSFIAEAASPPTSVPVAVQQPAPSTPRSDTMSDVQMILNDPENFRVVPKDISPVQAFAEGKTTKFLMGL